MKVRIPVMIQDPAISRYKGMPTEENVDIESGFFLDGPLTSQVAILDLREDGQLGDPAVFKPPVRPAGHGSYARSDEEAFRQISVFGTIMKTLAMFERADTLGRAVRWAFPGEQLLVVPRAGKWANAYYERASRSLQFFSFDHDAVEIHTSLSRDIVTHETGHAVLDGVAPDLYDAITPQALALHEAIADLVAVVMAFESSTLRETVLEQTDGSIAVSTAFSSIAEEFGSALYGARPLRNLNNNKGLVARDGIEVVERDEPHALSEVLSGALYQVMLKIHEDLTKEYLPGNTKLQAAGRALGIGSRRFARIVFRALDYLVPGEVSFADYGRAIIAADTAAHPGESAERDQLAKEFVRRGIVEDASELEVAVNQEDKRLVGIDRQRLIDSDWAAHEFVRMYPDLFGVPGGVPFELRPRLAAEKTYYHRNGKQSVRELIFNVSWEDTEESHLGQRYPSTRALTVGSTLAIDWTEPVVRARLVNELHSQQQEDRDAFLRRLMDQELLVAGTPFGPDLAPGLPARRNVVKLQVFGNRMRLKGSVAALHLAGEFVPDLEEEKL